MWDLTSLVASLFHVDALAIITGKLLIAASGQLEHHFFVRALGTQVLLHSREVYAVGPNQQGLLWRSAESNALVVTAGHPQPRLLLCAEEDCGGVVTHIKRLAFPADRISILCIKFGQRTKSSDSYPYDRGIYPTKGAHSIGVGALFVKDFHLVLCPILILWADHAIVFEASSIGVIGKPGKKVHSQVRIPPSPNLCVLMCEKGIVVNCGKNGLTPSSTLSCRASQIHKLPDPPPHPPSSVS